MDRPPRPAARPRILIVDDEPDVLLALEQTFKAFIENVDVVTASSGHAGLARLEEAHVDLILTDYRMPGMNGIEFLAAAREAGHDAARILVTAYPDMGIAIQALNEERIKAFLTKPLDADAFVATVEKVMRPIRSRMRREKAYAAALRRR